MISTTEVDIQCRRNALPAAPVLGLIVISFASVVVTIAAVNVFLIQQIIIRIYPRSRHCIYDREAGRKLQIEIIAYETYQLDAIPKARIIHNNSQDNQTTDEQPIE